MSWTATWTPQDHDPTADTAWRPVDGPGQDDDAAEALWRWLLGKPPTDPAAAGLPPPTPPPLGVLAEDNLASTETERVRAIFACGAAAAADHEQAARTAETRREQSWTAWLAAERERCARAKQDAEAEASRDHGSIQDRLRSAKARLQSEQSQTAAALQQRQSASAGGGGGAGAAEPAEITRSTALAQSKLDALRSLVQSQQSELEQLNAEMRAMQAQPKSAAPARQAWAGIPIESDAPVDMPLKLGSPESYSDSESDSASVSTDTSLLLFSALEQLDETDLSMACGGGGGGGLDQSSIYVSDAEMQRERTRLGRADKLIRQQMLEINERREKLSRTRASWRKDFAAVQRQRGGGSGSSSKLALLESVRKMLDQQDRHMSGEAKQLAAVAEYLQLRQDKLQIVELSVHGQQARGGGGRAGTGPGPAEAAASAPAAGGGGVAMMRRLESIENDLARVLRALHRSPPAVAKAPPLDPAAGLWADRRLGGNHGGYRAPAADPPGFDRYGEASNARWAAAAAAPLKTHDVNVKQRGGGGGHGQGKENIGKSKRLGGPQVQDAEGPVWDYQRLLGQWAEERDLTRELLGQHKVWMDSVKLGLDK
eukprot:SAG22_NODE_998_length_6115_cov_2.049701_3_plen_599_part_00